MAFLKILLKKMFLSLWVTLILGLEQKRISDLEQHSSGLEHRRISDFEQHRLISGLEDTSELEGQDGSSFSGEEKVQRENPTIEKLRL